METNSNIAAQNHPITYHTYILFGSNEEWKHTKKNFYQFENMKHFLCEKLGKICLDQTISDSFYVLVSAIQKIVLPTSRNGDVPRTRCSCGCKLAM